MSFIFFISLFLSFKEENHKLYIFPYKVSTEINAKAKSYIPSTINIWKKVLTKAIWAEKNGLVTGRLISLYIK